MSLALRPRRILDTETIARRVLGAFQLVDAVTGVPVGVPATVSVRSATLPDPVGEIALPEHAVRIKQNRSGLYVIFRAPFFDAYTAAVLAPQAPPDVADGPMRLRVSVIDAGPHHLPQDFEFDLPRALDPDAENNVFTPQEVRLVRAPGAPAQNGWALLRVSVRQANTAALALPGVLVTAFSVPRAPGDRPIGEGMTDWRGRARGEALVALTGIQRFRPGSGDTVVETNQEIVFEARRDPAFTARDGELPNVQRLRARMPEAALEIDRPDEPVRVQAGREYVVELTLP